MEPQIDNMQSIYNISGSVVNGYTSLKFTRKRDTGDQSDFPLTDGNCWYYIMAWGGTYNPTDGKASYHKNRISTDRKICISTCGKKTFKIEYGLFFLSFRYFASCMNISIQNRNKH